MNLELTGKTALVTASTAGIGLAIAESLFREGVSVVVNGRTSERVNAAMEWIRSQSRSQSGSRSQGAPGELRGAVADASTSEGIERITREFPRMDILVNNLGYYESKSISEISPADWARILEVNVVSGARLSQFYLPRMIEQDWGRIVFISSETAVNIPADMVHYGVSKAAQVALGRGLAEATAGTGVTVNSVLPGPTRSEGVTRFLTSVLGNSSSDPEKKEREFLQSLRPTSLIRRFAESAEVASLVTYLASPKAAATNGAAMRVEGGLLRNAF